MRAIVQDRYDTPGLLELEDISKPAIKDDDVLVRVRAVSANTYGWDLPAVLRYVGRKTSRFREQTPSIPGLELAGQVEAIGKNVSLFQPGDEVFGWCKGTFAEYVSVPEKALAPKPTNLTLQQAAVVPISGITALQALRDKGHLESGQKVLIIGASGGVGTYAVQIAKALGAEVTGVCSTRNLDMVQSIGADHVIDYTQDDFTRTGHSYDLIVDMAGNRSLSDLRRTLSPEGTFVMVGQSAVATADQSYFKAFGRWFGAFVLSVFGRQKLRAMLQTRRREDLLVLKEFAEAGNLSPVIDRTFPMNEFLEAIRYFKEGHAQGLVVITM